MFQQYLQMQRMCSHWVIEEGATYESSNVIFTQQWIMIIPRKADRVLNNISLNSLGMLGSVAISELDTELAEKLQKMKFEEIVKGYVFDQDRHYF